MKEVTEEKSGMERRAFLKSMGMTALGVGLSAFAVESGAPEYAHAQEPVSYDDCRIVVFGADGLGFNHAQTLRNAGAPALSSLSEPVCATSGGVSVTQPGWASVWSGLPSGKNKCWRNDQYEEMPSRYHIMKRLSDMYDSQGFYVAWITGKEDNVAGREGCPHYIVRKKIRRQGLPGVYYGDAARENSEVYDLACEALQDTWHYPNSCCFIHFQDPDDAGHHTIFNSLPNDYETYMEAALEVDDYISRLMGLLPPGTRVIYCSDHGFDFISQGDCRNGHSFSPYGMLATNFHTIDRPTVDRMAVGRLIYKAAGGDPDHCSAGSKAYRMFGQDLI
jgi:hypothetical protein